MKFETVDFDTQAVWEIYKNAKQAVEYYNDVINSIEERIQQGEIFDKLVVKQGAKKRVLTDEGIEQLVTKFGREQIYKQKETLITLKELEKLVPKDEQEQYIEYQYGKNKIVIEE